MLIYEAAIAVLLDTKMRTCNCKIIAPLGFEPLALQSGALNHYTTGAAGLTQYYINCSYELVADYTARLRVSNLFMVRATEREYFIARATYCKILLELRATKLVFSNYFIPNFY